MSSVEEGRLSDWAGYIQVDYTFHQRYLERGDDTTAGDLCDEEVEEHVTRHPNSMKSRSLMEEELELPT